MHVKDKIISCQASCGWKVKKPSLRPPSQRGGETKIVIEKFFKCIIYEVKSLLGRIATNQKIFNLRFALRLLPFYSIHESISSFINYLQFLRLHQYRIKYQHPTKFRVRKRKDVNVVLNELGLSPPTSTLFDCDYNTVCFQLQDLPGNRIELTSSKIKGNSPPLIYIKPF